MEKMPATAGVMRLPNLNLRRGDFCGTNIVLLTFGSRRGSLALGDMQSGITTWRAESQFIVIDTDLDKCMTNILLPIEMSVC